MNDFIKGVYTSTVVLSIIGMLLTAFAVKDEQDKWQNACDELDIEIRWHEMSLDGVTTNWVEMIDLRDNSVRKAR